MKTAHDVFAETNPGFCAHMIVGFVSTFVEVQGSGPELPLIYIALPLSLSSDLEITFEKTNRNTGLFEWYERSPYIQLGLAERLNESMHIVTDAVRFGCFWRVVQLQGGGVLGLGPQGVKRSMYRKLGEESGQSLKRAQRLGYWFAGVGSTKTVFDAMRIAL